MTDRDRAVPAPLDRRRFVATLATAGGAALALPPDMLALAQGPEPVTRETLAHAEKIAGLQFDDAQRDLMLRRVQDLRADYAALRAVPLTNSVPPAVRFDARVGAPRASRATLPRRRSAPPRVVRPSRIDDLAFLPVTALSELVRTRRVSSTELTVLCLDRLRRLDPTLHCVVSLTERRALAQAKRADDELAAGTWRGPLHGIPWGAKDLFAVRGTATTWGAEPYRDQVIDDDATVVRRLDDAGAVLVAKLTLGALASGDVWHGGQTCNPWNPGDGSSGSSAGPAAAVAAGLVPFAIGTETRGSIVSPCTRCGCTGLRPTFGRVSRAGAMALAWSMDKVGPIARTVEDCALVFEAILGPDGIDETVVDAPFAWDAERDVRTLRVGWVKTAFESAPDRGEEEWYLNDLAALATIRRLGVELIPIELPSLPVQAMGFILQAEAAAAFDELTRSRRDALLTRQDDRAWPNLFRAARLIPAVEYLQANRVRTLAMREMARITADLDAYIAPTYGADNLALTNLTGHPAVVLPDGFRANGTPTSLTITGSLFAEDAILALARAYQEATGWHLRRPPLDAAGPQR